MLILSASDQNVGDSLTHYCSRIYPEMEAEEWISSSKNKVKWVDFR
jgi:hypothetical protein